VLAVCQNDMRIGLWDANGQHQAMVTTGRFAPSPVAFSPDGRRLVACQADRHGFEGRLVLGTFDVAVDGPYQASARLGGQVSVPVAPLPDGERRGMDHMAFHPGGRFLALGFREGAARVVDTAAGTLAAEWTGFGGAVRAVPFSPDGRRLLVAGGRSVRVYDVAAKLVARPVPDLRLPHERELDRFAGEWGLVSSRIDGVDRRESGMGLGIRVVAVDPAATPKAVNSVETVGPDPGEPIYGIYEFLDTDTYRVCYSRDKGRRPTAFTAEKGDRQSLFVLKRAAPAAK
jgi:hypothetical protein